MIYLDNAATTEIALDVAEAMEPFLTSNYGNAGSLHSLGRDAADAINTARHQVAELLNCDFNNIIFTSGGSESNNLALKGTFPHLLKKGKFGYVLSSVEHDSSINAVKDLEKLCNMTNDLLIKPMFHLDFLPVNSGCEVSLQSLEDLLRCRSNSQNPIGLVSVMYENNITGAKNNVSAISSICHNKGALFHTDAVQAASDQDLDVQRIGCDLMSISGHKIHAPKGVGALYVRDRSLLSPIISGGASQEFGLRGGTENVAGIVGFGKACDLLRVNGKYSRIVVSELKNAFVQTLESELRKRKLLEILHYNAPNPNSKILNLRIETIDAQALVLMLDSNGVCISAGSACQSHESKPNRVLKEIGLSDEEARQSVRISFSHLNTLDEVKTAAVEIVRCIFALKNMAV